MRRGVQLLARRGKKNETNILSRKMRVDEKRERKESGDRKQGIKEVMERVEGKNKVAKKDDKNEGMK